MKGVPLALVVLHLLVVLACFWRFPVPIPRAQINAMTHQDPGGISFANPNSLVAARDFDAVHGLSRVKVLAVVDSPALLVCGAIWWAVGTPLSRVPPYERSYLKALMLLVTASAQWWLVGFAIARGLMQRKVR
jgi:hypothetical protein